MDATTRRLARHVLAADPTRLPAEALVAARRRLIDAIACAAAAFPEPFCERMRTFAARYASRPGARIWGSGAATSIEMAAFANGVMVRYLDHNDTFFGRANGHPSDMIPGLVAVAEAYEATGAALLAAIVAAYETYCGMLAAVPLARHGIDHGTCAAIGAAAGSSRLLGLDENATGEALALALAPNVHLYNVRTGTLADWKGCAGPNGSRNGVFAALLAREGVTAPTAVVEGKGGLAELTEPFEWAIGDYAPARILETHIKFHPVCYHGQSAIDAVLELRPQLRIDAIEHIRVETYDAAYRAMGVDPGRWAPANRETADHSLPYTIAVALENGVLRSDDYAEARLADPGLKRLMDKVEVKVSDAMTERYPKRVQTRITVRSAGGAEVSHLQEVPKGHATLPLTDAELEQKFLKLYAPWGDERAARRTLEIAGSIERMPRIDPLVDALCTREGEAP